MFDLILAAAWTWMGVRAIRHLGSVMLLVIPIYSFHLWQAVRWATARMETGAHPSKTCLRRLALHTCVVLAAVGCIVWKTAFAGDFGFTVSTDTQPMKAVEFVRSYGPPPRVFASYGFGGPIIRYFYPASRVYIDTRSELYTNEVGVQYDAILAGARGWDDALKTWKVDMLFLDHAGGSRPLAHFGRSPDWRCVYWDDRAVVFVLRGAIAPAQQAPFWDLANPTVFREMLANRKDLPRNLPAMIEELKRKVAEDTDCMLARDQLAACLLIQRQFRAAIEQWERVVERRPRHFVAWFNLGACYLEIGAFEQALECRRRAYKLQRGNPQLAYGVGEVLFEMHLFADSIPWFERALKLKPDLAPAKARLEAARKARS